MQGKCNLLIASKGPTKILLHNLPLNYKNKFDRNKEKCILLIICCIVFIIFNYLGGISPSNSITPYDNI